MSTRTGEWMVDALCVIGAVAGSDPYELRGLPGGNAVEVCRWCGATRSPHPFGRLNEPEQGHKPNEPRIIRCVWTLARRLDIPDAD